MDETNKVQNEIEDPADAAQKEAAGGRGGIIGALILFIKGIVVGMANIIPGVSGGTIAVVTGIFDPLINAINTLFKKFKKNIKFLLPVGLGLVVGVVAFSKLIGLSLDKFPLQTGLFFAGLVIGSVPLILKKAGEGSRFRTVYLVPFALCAMVVVAMAVYQTYFSAGTETVSAGALPAISFGLVIKLFFGGMLSAGAMVVPGVSGSLVMMLIGIYDDVLAMISGLVSFHDMKTVLSAALLAVPLALGIIAGIFTIAKIISILFKRAKTGTYYGILGLLCGSVLALLINLGQYNITYSVPGILAAVVALAAGAAIAFFSSRLGGRSKGNE
ncbi:MAG: DUF368 domain-containing protein [Clostridia bacterium]|nr:DUF368 domain-containing protein [Clostridia bacterium]